MTAPAFKRYPIPPNKACTHNPTHCYTRQYKEATITILRASLLLKNHVLMIVKLWTPPLLHMSKNLMIVIYQRMKRISDRLQRNLIPKTQRDLSRLRNLRIPLAFSLHCLVLPRIILTGRHSIPGFIVLIISRNINGNHLCSKLLN